MGYGRDDDELVVARGARDGVPLEVVELPQRLVHAEVVPRIDEEGGDVDLLVALVVGELVPPRVGETVGQDGLPVRVRAVRLLHHVDQGKRIDDGVQVDLGRVDRPRGVLVGDPLEFLVGDMGRWAQVDLGPGKDHPPRGGSEVERAAVVRPEIPVDVVGRAVDAAGRLRDHRSQVRRLRGRHPHLRIAQVGAAVGADLPVRPRPAAEPLDRIVPVDILPDCQRIHAFGLEAAPLVLHGHDVSLPDEHADHLSRVAGAERGLVVRRADQNHRERFRRAVGEVEIGGQTDAIAHRDPHRLLDAHVVPRFEHGVGGAVVGLGRGGRAPVIGGGRRTARQRETADADDKGSGADHGAASRAGCSVRYSHP